MKVSSAQKHSKGLHGDYSSWRVQTNESRPDKARGGHAWSTQHARAIWQDGLLTVGRFDPFGVRKGASNYAVLSPNTIALMKPHESEAYRAL